MEKALQSITEQLNLFLKDKGFTYEQGDLNIFTNGEKAFNIIYDESKKSFILRAATLSEGADVDFSDLSSWLFDENSDDRDVKSIINDYTDTIMKELNLKVGKDGSVNKIELPKKSHSVEVIDIHEFTARFLDLYQEYKEAYRIHMEQHGEFLFEKFYSEYGVKAVKKVLTSGSAKQQTKMMSVMQDCYDYGDNNVCAIITYTIFANAFFADESLTNKGYEAMEHTPYLLGAVKQMLALMNSPARRKKYNFKGE